MASAIDATKPAAGNATTQSVRENFASAKSEIEALQNSMNSAVQTQTNATTGATELLGPDGVIDMLPAKPAITTEWTRLAGPNDLATWTFNADIPTWSKSQELFRREGAAIRVDGSAMNNDYGNLSKSGLSWDLSAGGVIALLVYVTNVTSAITQFKVYFGTDYNNCRYAIFTFGDGQLQEGWNILPIHTNELNNYFFLQNKANVTGWGARVAGVDQGAAPIALGVGHNFATTPVSFCRIEPNNFKTSQVLFHLEGIYFGGYETPTLTIGFDIQGANLDVYSKPAMDAAGFKGYIASPTGNADPDNPTYNLLATEIARMQQYHAEGWNIIPHSVSHKSLGVNVEDAQRIADEYESCRMQLVRLGCHRGSDLFVAPNNNSDQRSIYELAKRGCRWQRASARAISINSLVGMVNPLLQGSISGGGSTLAYLQNAVDSLIMYGGQGNLFFHEVFGLATGAGTDGNGTDFPSASQSYKYTYEAIITYIKAKVDAGLLRVITPTQMLNTIGETLPKNTLGLPNQRTFSTGVTSPFTYVNRSYTPVRLLVSGGAVSAIDFAINGTTFVSTGQTAGTFLVQPGEAVKITFTVFPLITQYRVSA